MISAARIVFAGIGTISLILAIGIGGGLLLAKIVLKEPANYEAPARTEHVGPVTLPGSAEAAQPPQPYAAPLPSHDAETSSVKQIQAAPDRQFEKADPPKARAPARHKRYAQRHARKTAAVRARRQQEQWASEPSARITASEGYERRAGSFFGRDE